MTFDRTHRVATTVTIKDKLMALTVSECERKLC